MQTIRWSPGVGIQGASPFTNTPEEDEEEDDDEEEDFLNFWFKHEAPLVMFISRGDGSVYFNIGIVLSEHLDDNSALLRLGLAILVLPPFV